MESPGGICQNKVQRITRRTWGRTGSPLEGPTFGWVWDWILIRWLGLSPRIAPTIMPLVDSVPLLFVSLSSSFTATEWLPWKHLVGLSVIFRQRFGINDPYRPPHDPIPNHHVDLPICEHNIHSFWPLREAHSYCSTSGICIDLGHGLEKYDQMAGRTCEVSHEHGVSIWSGGSQTWLRQISHTKADLRTPNTSWQCWRIGTLSSGILKLPQRSICANRSKQFNSMCP